MLVALVHTGQISAIKDWATALAQSNPIYDGFAEAVLGSAVKLDMDNLRALSKGDIDAFH